METLEEVERKGNLQRKDIFICTDNMVSESIAAAGSSKSELLLYFIVKLHGMSMNFK